MTTAPVNPAIPYCLLLVDDERALLRAFAQSFVRAGYEVLEASDVPGAIAHWQAARERIALVLSDVQMPGPPIEDLIGLARRESPGVPIVLMSGEVGDGEERIARLRASVNALLAKPMSLRDLRLEVERHLPRGSAT
jgi:DNA-binding response OmpR family regulator